MARQLSINSEDRTSGSSSSSDFVVNLPDYINYVSSVELKSISLPNTLYNIRTGVNDVLDINDGG